MPLIPKAIPGKARKSGFDALKVDCPPTDNIASARYAMIGEAPSSVEVLEGEPFVGPSGGQLNRILAAAQMARHEIYITNACKAQLPKNKTDILWTSKGYKHPDWPILQKRLIDELAEFSGRFIIPLGATAMKLLLGSARFDSIAKFRGSIFKTDDIPHLAKRIPGKLIMPTYHPAFTLHYKSPLSFYVMIMDLAKILRVEQDPSLLDQPINLIIEPAFEKIMQFFQKVKSAKMVAFDIEATPKFVTCFSLAIKTDSAVTSMCIPLMDNKGNYWTVEQEQMIWTNLAEILLDSSIAKIGQNIKFDIMFVLRTMNIISDNIAFDTMLAQHLVYTELPKGLDFLTSVYTYHPYYKDEGKKSHLAVIKDWPSYWKYNARDSAYLFEIMENLILELDDLDLQDSMTYQMNLYKPIIEMEFNGVMTDQVGIKIYRKSLERKIQALQHGLNKLAGRDLNSNSSKQMISYFYGILMIKPYINRKTGNASCDTVALHRIAKRGKKGSAEAKIIIKMRKYGKLLTTYFRVNVDPDHKLRCSYNIAGTVSGRLSSAATFFETPAGDPIGTNLQNQPYVYKKFLMGDLRKEKV